MSVLGLLGAGAPVPEKPDTAPAGLRLRVEDALAAGRRLWVRGRLQGLADPAANRRWWQGWWGRNGSPGPPRTARLETRIGGSLSTAEVPLHADGRFEALFEADLPRVRRG